MLINTNLKRIRCFSPNTNAALLERFVFTLFFLLGVLAIFNSPVYAQGPVNGGFAGQVTDSVSNTPIAGATVKFINQANGFQTAKKSDQNGQFYQDTLPPGDYIIEVTYSGYEVFRKTQSLYATRSNSIIPVPVALIKETAAAATTPVNPNPSALPSPTAAPPPAAPTSSNQADAATSDIDENVNLNPRRDGAFNEFMVRTLPLGGTTLTRSFDELAFLVPGVLPPPQAIGNTVGPGVGGGVGTSGQFSVNGLRSRANNFTVDGSDNNDEDIGVRRQGFFALVPQPIESIQEFQIITLLAPAQYGRNLGAQVNALSKSGGNRFHGTLYGLFNSDRFNARNFFDNAGGNRSSILQGRRLDGTLVPVSVDGTPKEVFNDAGEKDSLTLLQGGFAIGGRLVRDKMFFFVSGEGHLLNATKESHFAVPTVEQRGLFGSGAEGLCVVEATPCPLISRSFPASFGGNAIFSLFPFPNDPEGIYERNTYTQALSADGRGRIFSGKYDYNFSARGRPQIFTARYNYTDDRRDLTDVGGALFSSIRPLVRTDNFSSFLSGNLTDNISNELRFSWGRTRLKFEELRDTTFLRPVRRAFNNPEDSRFLLNAPLLVNATLPGASPSFITVGETETFAFPTVITDINRPECNPPVPAPVPSTCSPISQLGAIGQLILSGFSPVGVDVFNFPQQRVNNTFQIADNLRWQFGEHSVTFGTDIRRTLLDSDLPRNSRPLVTINGSLNLMGSDDISFVLPQDIAAAGGATGFFQSLVLPGHDARIKLGYYQLNFFVQDEWRARSNLLVSYGLRYEYNTPPEEADEKIESTFRQALPNAVSGLSEFIDERKRVFDPDRNNFAPRISFAYSPDNSTVIRGGYGLYYDQILGAVISQSRNAFPTFTTMNFGAGLRFRPPNAPLNISGSVFSLFNPLSATFDGNILVQPGTLNTLNPSLVVNNAPSQTFLNGTLNRFSIPFPGFPGGNPFGVTLPTRDLDIPLAHQYSIGIEREIFRDTFVSAAYVGTTGRNLLRFTSPNGGINYFGAITGFVASSVIVNNLPLTFPLTFGGAFDPPRQVANIGSISQFETTGHSRYNSLQIEFRGRLGRSLQYLTSYTFGQVKDDISDVFDLSGSFALPQNSLTKEGEYAPANFDVRHRFTYAFVYDFSEFNNANNPVFRFLLGGWQIAGTGKFNTGQPFTVNSIYDVNLDGNLTDRLDNTQFIAFTGNGRQPIRYTGRTDFAGMLEDKQSMLAIPREDGQIERNSFRAGNIIEMDLSFLKRFTVRENQYLQFRVDVFNFINRANFGIPVRFLEAPGFGQATDTVTPGRRVQFGLKYVF